MLALVAGLFELIGAEMMDGGIGSFLFVIFALTAAPFLITGRIVTALMSGAPVPLQIVVVMVSCVGVALLLDRPLRAFLPEPADGG